MDKTWTVVTAANKYSNSNDIFFFKLYFLAF